MSSKNGNGNEDKSFFERLGAHFFGEPKEENKTIAKPAVVPVSQASLPPLLTIKELDNPAPAAPAPKAKAPKAPSFLERIGAIKGKAPEAEPLLPIEEELALAKQDLAQLKGEVTGKEEFLKRSEKAALELYSVATEYEQAMDHLDALEAYEEATQEVVSDAIRAMRAAKARKSNLVNTSTKAKAAAELEAKRAEYGLTSTPTTTAKPMATPVAANGKAPAAKSKLVAPPIVEDDEIDLSDCYGE